MAVPYTFGTATAAIPLSQLDSNFATAITIGNTAVQLGNTVTTLNNMTLANVTISSGTITITNVSVTTANVSGTANVSTLVVVGNATVGGNTTITGNITAANANVTSNLVLSGGTANGVAYLNGSKVVTSGSALVFDGSQLGIGTASGTSNGLKLNSGNAGANYVLYRATATGLLTIYGNQTGFNGLSVTGVDGDLATLTSTGLGIGVTSPVSILDVNAKGTGTTPNAVKTYTSYMHGSTIGTNVGELTGWGVRYGTIAATPVWYGARFLRNGVNAASDFTIWTSPDGDVTTLAERVTVTASGNFGLGTTSPLGIFNIKTSNGQFLVQNGASSAEMRISAFNNAGSANAALIFEGYSSEYGRFDSSGNLLVGKTTAGNSINGAQLSSTYQFFTNTSDYISIFNRRGTDGISIYFQKAESNVGTISVTTVATTFNSLSDYRLKNITGSLTGAKDFIMALQPKQGTWKADGSKFVGFLAHEFQEISPSSVTGEKDAVDADGKPIMQSMQASSAEVMANLISLVQEQQALITQLTARITALEGA